MKHLLKLLTLLTIGSVWMTSCKKEAGTSQNEISQATLLSIADHGFGTSDVQKMDEGYLVEGDIILTEGFLGQPPAGNLVRIANNEQYRTTNLVNQNRVITLALDSKLMAKPGYIEALSVVRDRYNAQNLTLHFEIVSSGADITFVNAHGKFLAASGFPSDGNPFSTVLVNANKIGKGTNSTFINFVGTIMTHETGHCIGFRHTDFMDRSFSCGGAPVNEGASTVGAILIPGTPSGPDAGSWMLSCISQGEDRPFNANDIIALAFLY